MVQYIPRKQVLDKLYEKVAAREPILGAGAGIGIIAKMAELAGIDFIVIYNSGRFRMAGFGSLAGLMPYGDAHQILLDLAQEVLSVVDHTPVLAGVTGTHPFYQGYRMKKFLEVLKDMGFSGVQNFPTVGLIDKNSLFRRNLEESGMGYDKEVVATRMAHELDMVTTPYVFDEEDTIEMIKAGADVVVIHLGLTAKGTIGARTTLSLQDGVRITQHLVDVARSQKSDIITIVHGGPVADVDDFKYVAERVKGLHGFFGGATTFERLPVEKAVPEQIRAFKSIRMNPYP
ncbi:phosphoenolpyruvate hydrolase family protein [Vulcanisaeta souniana]|uniref:phosphoenolpyruvate hydrolase family protein n=1 Tax=Vulcanisaeta souniana TaxID=164452 RepID=UPI0006CF5595|nr:phosphoenolpyruvate hydrolase family protein [Vulcanisaeta souniana]